MRAVATTAPRPPVGFGVVCDVIRIFSAPNGPNKGVAGHEDAVRTAGACDVSSTAGEEAFQLVIVLVEVSCVITVCASEGGARDVDADVSKNEDGSRDVKRAMDSESSGGNAIKEGWVAMSPNLVATPSEMYN
jgi:hypothetical protein